MKLEEKRINLGNELFDYLQKFIPDNNNRKCLLQKIDRLIYLNKIQSNINILKESRKEIKKELIIFSCCCQFRIDKLLISKIKKLNKVG
jgi:hypothetical protein